MEATSFTSKGQVTIPKAVLQRLDIAAQNNLGVIYEQGKGVAKDLAATGWYRKEAEAGDKVAQLKLGVLYRDGLGVNRNEAEALTWFQKSADQGYAKAQLNLGQLFEKLAGQKKKAGVPGVAGLYRLHI